jgi:hypothetical protein
MVLVLCLFTILVAVALGFGTLRAVRADHLLVFYFGEGGLFLFVRRGGGRYERIPFWRVPAVVVQFEAVRLRQRWQRPKPAPALVKAQPVHRFARLA